MKGRYSYIAYLGLLSALALILSYLESLIPIPVAIPGIKIGLANIIVIFILYQVSAPVAIVFSLCRVVFAALLFSGFSGFLFSAAGAVFAWAVMALMKKTDRFSVMGVSLAGGVSHNLGQLLMAAIVTKSPGILAAYLPVLILAGCCMGLVNGAITQGVMRAMKAHPISKQTMDTLKK